MAVVDVLTPAIRRLYFRFSAELDVVYATVALVRRRLFFGEVPSADV